MYSQRASPRVEHVRAPWRDFPLVKILRAFEMRRDVAASALENEGDCTEEGKGRGGAHRVHSSPSYAALRAALGVETDPW